MASDVEKSFINWLEGKLDTINKRATFRLLATQNTCVRNSVAEEYKKIMDPSKDPAKFDNIRKTNFLRPITRITGSVRSVVRNININSREGLIEDINISDDTLMLSYADRVIREKPDVADDIVARCGQAYLADKKSNENITNTVDKETTDPKVDNTNRPFDKRLDRLEMSFLGNKSSNEKAIHFVPFGYVDVESKDFGLSTTGYLISQNTVNEIPDSAIRNKALEKAKEAYGKMKTDSFYQGVPALQNYYALVRFYGSEGGQFLVNQKGKRRWYEIDSTSISSYNFASVPTTSSLISWGNGDPYGRTPYQFTDFVFSKYWNKIENNRLITLRRYAAPILDNLKFPGMTSQNSTQFEESGGGESGSNVTDGGNTKTEVVAFPPMATAITYFGGETGNTLNNILKFTTGVSWEDAQAAVWEVQTDSVPGSQSGPGKIFGGLARFAEMLNVAGGNYDRALAWNAGQLPPDPYKDGPYENRIMGPMNRIDTVKKRKPGLQFEWEGLNLTFEYVSRPVGGINPKAVLLDIISNFLVMGSANAVFFGGAHRFMANPATYPFIGGGEGVEQWYSGQPLKWASTVIKQFTQGGSTERVSGNASIQDVTSSLWNNVKGFFNNLLSGKKGSIFGAIDSLFTGATGNIIENELAKGTGGHVPYLQGMKAILTGEPIGEWHVTIGNPLNPIAMIGNLICDGITVEFNEELGPDDFPTEIKISVKLKHAMARDKSAIESIFNRGMGRIYDLPDSFAGSADYQTIVDDATKKDGRVNTGYAYDARANWRWKEGLDGRYLQTDEGSPLSMGGETSVWRRASFTHAGISDNSAVQFLPNNEIFLSSYRAADWIAQRALI